MNWTRWKTLGRNCTPKLLQAVHILSTCPGAAVSTFFTNKNTAGQIPSTKPSQNITRPNKNEWSNCALEMLFDLTKAIFSPTSIHHTNLYTSCPVHTQTIGSPTSPWVEYGAQCANVSSVLKDCGRQRAKASVLELLFYSPVEGDEKGMRKVRNVLCTHHLLCSMAPHTVWSCARGDAMERSPWHWPSGTEIVLFLVGYFVHCPLNSQLNLWSLVWSQYSIPHPEQVFVFPARKVWKTLDSSTFMWCQPISALRVFSIKTTQKSYGHDSIQPPAGISTAKSPPKHPLQVHPSWTLSYLMWKNKLLDHSKTTSCCPFLCDLATFHHQTSI